MATVTRRLAALLGASGAGLTDSATASKITTDSINDDAVTNAKIGTDAVNADSIVANAVGTSEVADNVLTATDLAANSVGESELSVDYTAQSVPHIIPGVLYPSYVASGTSNKLLDGTTDHSGAFGTTQSDGRKYYYTNIKGSKPIKDPRIGAHFGSQRHKVKSLQIQEQESAIRGDIKDVYSIDGREWMRMVAKYNNALSLYNASGNFTEMQNANDFIEITGYFNDINLILLTYTTGRHFTWSLDGGSANVVTSGRTTKNSPLHAINRYVDAGSLYNVGLGTTLGIHTLKILNNDASNAGQGFHLWGIDLIAQNTQNFTATNASNILTTTGHTLTNGDQIRLTGSDLPNGLNATTTYYVVGVSGNNFQVATSSGGSAVTFSDDGSGTRTWRALNNIQIPSQNVVCAGKKFSISATETHYDPFTTMSYGGSGTTASALGSLIDTATSLGMDNWKAGTANYHRPWNGGRVVKWVDSAGTIKTSVTMMPPNAQNVTATASNAVSNAHQIAGTNDDIINFDTTTIANASDLSEVAKSFHFREFGNGAANQGTGGSYADASMLNTTDDIAFCMDDGLTSLIAKDAAVQTGPIMGVAGTSDSESYITFIGTGMGYHSPNAQGSYISLSNDIVAQNLPYGTHIIRNGRKSGGTLNNVDVDGVEVKDDNSNIQGIEYIDIYQPKKPPIPEDAVVLADYMLMADYVAQTSGTAKFISKGVRRNNASRDLFYDTSASTLTFNVNVTHAGGFQLGVSGSQNADVFQGNLPAFATRIDSVGYGDRRQIYVDGGSAEAQSVNGTGADAVTKMTNAQALGSYTFKSKNKASTDGTISAIDVVTPIHTSHHYQSFETPYLHELIGGDRNMEQTHLICTSDGKTWDEVTRDTSYIGSALLKTDHNEIHANQVNIFDEWRGGYAGVYQGERFNKDFAIARDRMICLKEGNYLLTFLMRSNKADDAGVLRANGQAIKMHKSTAGLDSQQTTATINLKRGDYVEGWGVSGQDGVAQYNILINFQIVRL